MKGFTAAAGEELFVFTLSLSLKIHLVYVASVFPGDDLNAGCEIAINCNAACLLSKMTLNVTFSSSFSYVSDHE